MYVLRHSTIGFYRQSMNRPRCKGPMAALVLWTNDDGASARIDKLFFALYDRADS
jgi:hypothetical protein